MWPLTQSPRAFCRAKPTGSLMPSGTARVPIRCADLGSYPGRCAGSYPARCPWHLVIDTSGLTQSNRHTGCSTATRFSCALGKAKSLGAPVTRSQSTPESHTPLDVPSPPEGRDFQSRFQVRARRSSRGKFYHTTRDAPRSPHEDERARRARAE